MTNTEFLEQQFLRDIGIGVPFSDKENEAQGTESAAPSVP